LRGELIVVDVSDPVHPVEAGRIVTPGQAMGVVASGDRLFLADGSAGLAVYDGGAACLGDPSPSVRIVSLGLGGAVANHAPLSVAVEGFELDCDGPVEPGRGRWQLWVDDTLDSEACTPTATLSGWYPRGRHIMRAVLVDGAGEPLEPPVEDWIPVLLRGHAYPSDSVLAGGSVDLAHE
jgi:hypothetical protein